MPCGCGSSLKARRPARSVSNKGVLHGLNNPAAPKNIQPNVHDERRIIEKQRRDAILRALGRPS
jgi:hypothetical protein